MHELCPFNEVFPFDKFAPFKTSATFPNFTSFQGSVKPFRRCLPVSNSCIAPIFIACFLSLTFSNSAIKSSKSVNTSAIFCCSDNEGIEIFKLTMSLLYNLETIPPSDVRHCITWYR